MAGVLGRIIGIPMENIKSFFKAKGL